MPCLGEAMAWLVKGSHAAHLGCQCSLTGPVQDSGLKRHYDLYLATMESGLDAAPDWRRTAFWRESSFMQAQQKAQKLPRSGVETGAELDQPMWCGLLHHITCMCRFTTPNCSMAQQ